MKVFWAKDGLPEGNISDEDQRKFQEANHIFVGVVHRPDVTLFKRWSIKVTNWLMTMKVFWAKDGLPEGNISDEDQRKF
jgi:hypothetical protein